MDKEKKADRLTSELLIFVLGVWVGGTVVALWLKA
jgi:hypothetical protein